MVNSKKKERNIAAYARWSEMAIPALSIVVDYIMIVLAELVAYYIRSEVIGDYAGIEFTVLPVYLYCIVPAIFLFFLHIGKANSFHGQPFWQTMRMAFWAVLYSMLTIVLLMYLGHVANDVSRLFVAMTGVFSFFFIAIGRYICKRYMSRSILFQMPVVFIGAGITAEKVLASFSGDVGFGYRVVGFIDDHPVSQKIAEEFRILGGFQNADKIVRRLGVKRVFVTSPGLPQQDLVTLVNKIQPYVKSVSFVPDIMGTNGKLEIVNFVDAQLMMIKVRNNLSHWYNRAIKRVFDVALCSLGMVVVVPLTIIIGTMIYLDNPGTIFFAHRRIGKGGKEFPCYKFRSMITNSQEALEKYLAENPAAREEWNRDFKLKNDPRITKIGSFLRKTSLDELPQLLNVIKGDMSLVGPRPIVKAEIEKYGDYINDFYMVPPGITGVWQVNGRSDTTYDERVAMDSWYVHNWSVWLDISYLIKTITVVLQRKGAY